MTSAQSVARPRFSRAVVHIGTERTGTTTIQGALTRNRELLSSNGILFPSSLGPSSHGALATICQSIEPSDEFARNAVRQYGGNLTDARMQVRDAFESEIGSLETPAHTLVISSEHLHSRLVTLEEKQRLADFLKPWVERIEIIVYLRSQSDLARSVYNFRVKNGGTGDGKVYPKLDRRTRPYFDYMRMLDEYEQVCGEGTVTPVIFEPSTFPDRDVVRDFLQRTDLLLDDLDLPESTNESLSAPAVDFMREFNRIVPKRIDDRKQPMRRTVDRFAAHYDGPGFATPAGEAEAFQAHFDDDNERLRSRYFPERDRLFSARSVSTPPVETTKEELVRFGALLYVECQDELAQSRQKARDRGADAKAARARGNSDLAATVKQYEAKLTSEQGRALLLESRLARAEGKRDASVELARKAVALSTESDAWAEEARRFAEASTTTPLKSKARRLAAGLVRRLRREHRA